MPQTSAQMLCPTYKQRNEDFRKLFSKLPEAERLIVGESPCPQPQFLSWTGASGLPPCWFVGCGTRARDSRICLSLPPPFSDYSCALQREILLQGRLYLSENWICFYSNIFRWETTVSQAAGGCGGAWGQQGFRLILTALCCL